MAERASALHSDLRPTGKTDLTGGGFALTYHARTASDIRAELGARFDREMLWLSHADLIFRIRELGNEVVLQHGASPLAVAEKREIELANGQGLSQS
jgi:hypothetical protein